MTRYFTVKQVGEVLGFKRKKVYALINSGKLRSVRIGRQHRVEYAALREFCEALRREAALKGSPSSAAQASVDTGRAEARGPGVDGRDRQMES